MTLARVAIIGYAIGSIPFSFIVARLFGVKDVRTVGSGNVGATNVMRSAGKVPGILALILDGSKGAIAVWIARALQAPEAWVCVAGICAVIGHLFPVWLSFRGGKGVATGAGLFIPLAPQAVALAIVVFLVTLGVFRFVSLASIVASVALPVAAYVLGFGPTITLTAVVAASMVVARHHANLGRLVRGLEPKLGAKK